MYGTNAQEKLVEIQHPTKHGTTSQLSQLQVCGCAAYVHIQKYKHAPLDSHMEKCVLIGYPNRYKGWKFYVPSTCHTIISERAEFDEGFFLMREKQNPKMGTSQNVNIEQVNTEPLKRKR